MSKSSVAIAALVAFSLPAIAGADTKALTAAKANLPNGANIIVGVNVGSITGSKLFQTLWPSLLAKAGAAKEQFELANTACKIDPWSVINDIVFAVEHGPDQAKQKGAIFIGVKGVDQAKLESCAVAIGKATKKPVATFKKDGTDIEVTPPIEKPDPKAKVKAEPAAKTYYRWLSPDVIVVSFEGDKAALAKWTGGKGGFAKGALAGTLAKVNTAGAAWGASTMTKALQPGIDMKGGFGWLAFDKGMINAEVHATLGDTKQASSTAEMANKQITGAKANAQLPPAMTTILGNIKITAVGSEVVVKAAANEGDLSGIFGMLMAM